mgnify:CR=1 FL=1|tara:strand:- start:1650 stop:1934 length:285 start_codon:yes stop_codon:yes gene_type:complete
MWSIISIEFYVISAIVFGLLGRYIAKQNNRSGAEGFWLGLLFSALSLIIVALLPKKEESVVYSRDKEDKVIWISTFVIILILFFYSGFVREDFK